MVKALLRYVQASEDYFEFYEWAIEELKRAKVPVNKVKNILGFPDLESFYRYHKYQNKEAC